MKYAHQHAVTRFAIIAIVALLPLLIGGHSVAIATTGITSYSDFLKGVRYSKFEQFENRINAEVLDKNVFAAMQNHILRHYRRVKITNSFLGQSGSPIDCVALKSQPSLQSRKMRGHKLATPPNATGQCNEESTGHCGPSVS